MSAQQSLRKDFMKFSNAMKIIFMTFVLLSFSFAHAQLSSNAAPSKPKEKVKNLNFEDELVEGATQKPELFYLFQKKNFNYKRLIKLRENFVPEMKRTSEDIQRSRSTN